MKGLFFILSLSVCSLFHPAMAQYRSEVWVSDEGNGMYRNPVLHADYSVRGEKRSVSICGRSENE